MNKSVLSLATLVLSAWPEAPADKQGVDTYPLTRLESM